MGLNVSALPVNVNVALPARMDSAAFPADADSLQFLGKNGTIPLRMRETLSKTLVIRVRSAGDIILATPHLRALRARFPNAEIDIAVKRDYAGLIRHHPALTNIIELPGGQDGEAASSRLVSRPVEEGSRPCKPVYDILNAGPRQRFVVKGNAEPFIVHNCTQALARIIVMSQLLRIAKKYRVTLTVHDSILAVVREAELGEARAYIESCMRWASLGSGAADQLRVQMGL